MDPLIDYYGESAETEETPISFQGMKEYWRSVYQTTTGGVYQWSMKDQTLLSRLMKEYSTEDLVPMIDWHFQGKLARMKNPNNTFGFFYTDRAVAYKETHKPENYGFN